MNTITTTAWRAGERFMLRVAGLPLASADALRSQAVRRWAEDVLAAEEALRADAQWLSEVLHRAVAATDPEPGGSDAARRRDLLRLRRQIHNGRLPADAESALRLMDSLTPTPEPAPDSDAPARLAGWLGRQRELEKLLGEGEPLLAADLRRGRAALRDLLGDERLRHGLLLASPVLEGQLDAYAQATARGGEPGGRARKAERSVLSYLYRTACKTSPFSTFTGVATGRFTPGTEAQPDGIRVEDDWRSHVRLNVVVLARLAELVLADPVRRRDLPLRPASGWGQEDDRIRYVRRSVTAGDDSAAVTFDAVKDRLFFLRRSGTLERLLALFAERAAQGGAADLRHEEVADWLAAEHAAGPAECEAYIGALLQLGMVRVPCLDTEVHGGDPVRAFQRSLSGLDRPWADALGALLEEPARILERYPDAGRAERAELLRALRSGLRRVWAELGAPADAALPQTLVYEDVSAGRELAAPEPAWARAEGGGGALRSVERILPAFDLTLAQRITFEGFFTARYGQGGRCEDLLGLVHDFHEDFFDQYLSFTARRTPFDARGEYVPEENWLGLPGIRALDAARRAFVGRMREHWAAYEEHGGEGELRLTEEDVERVADELEPVVPGFVPRCHHVQLARDPATGEQLTVLNRSYGGLSFPFSRFTHVFEEEEAEDGGVRPGLDGLLRAGALETTPPGAVLAEVTGGPVTTNLNLHGRLTEYEIVCPGESGTLPEDRLLRLDDLYAEHVPDTGRVVLRSRRLGVEVIPVYLGYLVPLALPVVPRTLLLLSPSSMSPLDVWAGVPDGVAHGGVTTRPRVVHGDLVLSRRSWITTAGELPVRGAREAAHFLEWQRWRRAHGLPERVFATVSAGPSALGAKPQYVDFASLLSLAAFEPLLREPGHRVVFREMLPDPDAPGVPYARSARGAHVAELAVETFTTTTTHACTPIPEGGTRCQS
ncbi:lantibiotic dehydratase family protein [Streptomyces sp. NBC_00249]|uniref:lantibiotic dehydratase n=1 Tax=Streptomyces sp. NBC_00249 TaxID=2975690 RepID=UPI002258AD99|nr:lantibiotic dehydratase [Streptomyces sp. NBC_00249]MCX5192575.1 lantibiotic dehydratase family protein [Streptomyces sp. NBC_00249]